MIVPVPSIPDRVEGTPILMTLGTARAMTSVSRRRRNLLLGEILGRLARGLVAALPWLIAYQPFSRLPKKKPTVAAARA